MTALHWHPEVVAGLGGLLALYLLAVGPLRHRLAREPRPPARQVAAFVGGVAVLALALLGPLAEWAEHVALSAHMAQHLLLTLVVPPLWLLGTPAWVLRPLAGTPGIGRAGLVLTRPVAALGLASAVLVLWHVPRFFEAALRTDALHALEHLTLLGTACLLWWPVAGPLPQWPRPSPPAQLLYLFLATIPMTAVSAPITAAESVLYPFYAATAAGGATWPLAPRADQELAGVLMWVGGSLPYLVAGTIVYFRWALAEEPGTAGEPSGA